MLTQRSARGFSLIELMVSIAVAVLLALLAVPSLSEFVENSKVRGTAELLYASMQQARTEAIRRNATVEFILTSDSPDAGHADTDALSLDGPNWMVRQVPPAGSTDAPVFIEGRTGAEGGGRAGSQSAVIAATANTVSFNPLGAAAGAVVVNLSSASGACAPAGSVRCLRVVVSPGGQVRMCDPAAAGAGDTRRC